MRKQLLHILTTFFLSLFINNLHSQVLTWQSCGALSGISSNGSPSYFNNSKTFTGVPLSNTDVQIAIGLAGCNPVLINAGGIKLDGTTFIVTDVPVQNCGFTVNANNFYTISKSVFNQAVIDGGGTIVFKNFIHDTCVPGYGCDFISDPCIKMTVSYGVLASESFDKQNFSVYPNPVKDILYLSYDKKISSITIYNLVGQEIINQEINANNCKIDTSKLPSATYFAKIIINNEEKTIKIIKN